MCLSLSLTGHLMFHLRLLEFSLRNRRPQSDVLAWFMSRLCDRLLSLASLLFSLNGVRPSLPRMTLSTHSPPSSPPSFIHLLSLYFVSCMLFIFWRSVCFKHSGGNFQILCCQICAFTAEMIYGAILCCTVSISTCLTFDMFHLWDMRAT